jgi:hypothetical protein
LVPVAASRTAWGCARKEEASVRGIMFKGKCTLELGQEAYEVLERAAESIDRPSHDRPEAPTRGIFAKRVEGWLVLSRLRPAYTFVAIEFDNLQTHTGRGCLSRSRLRSQSRAVLSSGPDDPRPWSDENAALSKQPRGHAVVVRSPTTSHIPPDAPRPPRGSVPNVASRYRGLSPNWDLQIAHEIQVRVTMPRRRLSRPLEPVW